MKTIVSLSGGLDSTVLLAHCLANGDEIIALSFYYGQRHNRELRAAKEICEHFDVAHRVVDVPDIGRLFAELGSDSALLYGQDVPHGHYAHENMVKTIVPNRNAIFASILMGACVATKADRIALAPHNGDAAIYPDCRPSFYAFLTPAFALGNDLGMATGLIYTPFVDMSKADIVKVGATLGVPFKLTWSCYEGGETHCSVCGTCYERREAFEDAGVTDPTEYHLTYKEWKEWQAHHEKA